MGKYLELAANVMAELDTTVRYELNETNEKSPAAFPEHRAKPGERVVRNCSTHRVTGAGAVYTALGLKEFSCIGCAGMSQALHDSAARFDPAYRSAEGRADPCFVAAGSGPGGACGRA